MVCMSIGGGSNNNNSHYFLFCNRILVAFICFFFNKWSSHSKNNFEQRFNIFDSTKIIFLSLTKNPICIFYILGSIFCLTINIFVLDLLKRTFYYL